MTADYENVVVPVLFAIALKILVYFAMALGTAAPKECFVE